MSVSPYALLKASKPKPPQTMTTSYDLYSLLGEESNSDMPRQQQPAPSPGQTAPDAAAQPASKRTHYIADIHARHTDAMRHARQQSP